MDKRIEEFKNIAQMRWVYMEKGDSKNGNKCFDKLNMLFKELKEENRMDSLKILLDYPNNGVKIETASKLLPFYPEKAMCVLEDLSMDRGILPFTAKQTLKQWKNGKME